MSDREEYRECIDFVAEEIAKQLDETTAKQWLKTDWILQDIFISFWLRNKNVILTEEAVEIPSTQVIRTLFWTYYHATSKTNVEWTIIRVKESLEDKVNLWDAMDWGQQRLFLAVSICAMILRIDPGSFKMFIEGAQLQTYLEAYSKKLPDTSISMKSGMGKSKHFGHNRE